MKRSQKRLILLVLSLIATVVATAVIYEVGMAELEGKPRSFLHSLEWAAETLSTTGYGSDAEWHHPFMVIYVVVVQFLGVFLIFLIFPIYLIPFLEERFETRLPADCADARDHVLIYRSGPAVTTLIEVLKRADVVPIVIEESESDARRVQEAGTRVVHGTLEGDVMERVALPHARAVILNGSDHRNAAIAITARQLDYKGEIVGLVEDPLHRQPTLLAGATVAYTPRHVLGAALAARASRKVSPTISGVHRLGGTLQIGEVRIGAGSRLAGRSLSEARIAQEAGVTVIGQWIGSELLSPPKPDMRLEPGGILILIGSAENIGRFTEICSGTTSLLRSSGPFIVAGNGEVGGKVVELLRDAGEETRLIDLKEGDGVDRAGNVLDPEFLESVGVKDAQAVILALSEDATTLFATVILKDLAPNVPVIARVNSAENVDRIHGAGAEFALSISQVTGQIVARKLLGKRAVSLDRELQVSMVASPALTGGNPGEMRIRQRTGCSVVAVERGPDIFVQIDRDFAFAEGDQVYICGSEEATRMFSQVFPPAEKPKSG